LVLAVWYRSEGPQRPVPFYEREEEDDEEGYEENDTGESNQVN